MVEDSTAFSAKDHFAKVFSKVPPTAILPGTPTEIAMVCRRKRHKKRGCAERSSRHTPVNKRVLGRDYSVTVTGISSITLAPLPQSLVDSCMIVLPGLTPFTVQEKGSPQPPRV